MRVRVKVRSRKVTKINNSFSGMLHMIPNHFCTKRPKIETILQSDTMHVNDSAGSGQPRVTLDQTFELVFSNKKMCVSELVRTTNSKMSFSFLCDFYKYLLKITV